MAFIKPRTTPDTKPASFRISTALHADIEAARKECQARGGSLDLTGAVERAIRAELKRTRAELAAEQPATG